jgi:HKD family nuclease
VSDDSRHQILLQLTGEKDHLYERLNELLEREDLVRVRMAVAYARWDGIGLIAENLESFLADGGEFQCIYGVNNGVTTPDSFLYSLYLQELYGGHSYAGAVEDAYKNATFHPKFFEFQYKDETIAVIGSANLTGGGLARNAELCVEVSADNGSDFVKSLENCWDGISASAIEIDLDRVRKLAVKKELGSEEDEEPEAKGKVAKPAIGVDVKLAKKPLFEKILDVEQTAKKAKLLTSLDPLTDKPRFLYLEIFETETGGSGGNKGYQVQLPAATLPAYFGLGPYEDKLATFHFSGEDIEAHFTHFYNNTHRVRLRPILDVERPAVLRFERIAANEYSCKIYPKNDHAAVLAAKCDQQTRAGARRWGISSS